jgi:transposase
MTQDSLFSDVDVDERVPKDYPLRRMRLLVDGILASLSDEFAALYSHTGRPSVAPEKLLRALLLQVLYTIRSERQLVEQLDYNLLFRWFVGLGIDDPVWDRTVFCANRDRLLSKTLAREFFDRVLAIAEWRDLVSDEHFSVDGTLIEAWASHKSFVRKDGGGPDRPAGRNPEVDFSGEKRSNATHQSTTDPEARLYKKGEFTEAKLQYHPRLGGEPAGPDRRRRDHPGDRHGRSRSGGADDRPDGVRRRDRRRGQGLRPAQFRGPSERSGHSPAYCLQEHGQCHRWPHGARERLRPEP